MWLRSAVSPEELLKQHADNPEILEAIRNLAAAAQKPVAESPVEDNPDVPSLVVDESAPSTPGAEAEQIEHVEELDDSEDDGYHPSQVMNKREISYIFNQIYFFFE